MSGDSSYKRSSKAAAHLLGVHDLELPVGALPCDQVRVARVAEQLEQELPQLDLTSAAGAAASTAACMKPT